MQLFTHLLSSYLQGMGDFFSALPRQGLGTTSASSPCCVCSPHFSLPLGRMCSAIIDYIFAEFDFIFSELEIIFSELEIIIAQLDFTFSGHELIFTVIAPLFGVGVY